jgi:Putative metal-binding motif
MKSRIVTSLLLFLSSFGALQAQHSVARQWNEMLIYAIRGDFGRPTIHARNLFHTSVAMYDAWAVYDNQATTYLLGKTVGNFTSPFNGIVMPANIAASRDTAISYAMYRVLRHRFANSPGNTNPNFFTSQQLDFKMLQLGFDISITSTDYTNDGAAALGNYIAQQVINYGFFDGANEQGSYANQYYQPLNPPMVTKTHGNPNLIDFNRWQPLTLDVFIDQNGNVIPFNTPPALTPEWGNVTPFAMTNSDMTVFERDNHVWRVYHDPGAPPQMVMGDAQASAEYIWNFALVSAWSSHLAPDDNAIMDVSPASIGNVAVEDLPTNFAEYQSFYNLEDGGVNQSNGHTLNPKTGQAYAPQYVTRGDYARVLAEFWADGPNSDTPPGHWFEILNYAMDHPDFVRKYKGEGEELDPLEYDVKAYFMLGGALHDAAVTAWGIKGYYDGIRPVSAIRGMAELGQSTDQSLPNYHPNGLPLIPGLIEIVEAGDPLAGANNQNVGEVKLLAWNGPDSISSSANDEAGVGWILADYWWPYQRPTFVSPPFPGYISGHSTYSRTAAEVLTTLTGDPFFPGGLGEFICPQNQFLVFEDGPAQTVKLQWATYRDASDQCSLSRIWGGIHPPADDIPGRFIGIEIAADAVTHAETYFYKDEDGDTFYSNTDCNDNNPAINPQAPETCDGIDNNCDGQSDEGLALNTYYRDNDADTYGNAAISESSCQAIPTAGFVNNNTDCNDNDAFIHPGAAEACDNIDNDCDGVLNNGLQVYTYYIDVDGDSFGFGDVSVDTCDNTAPLGYVNNFFDCNDNNAAINLNATEVCDNIDNDCDGIADDGLPLFTYFLDADGDGFGAAAASQTYCLTTPPAGYATNDTDCNDADATVNPAAIDVALDGIDNNCDGILDAIKDVVQRNWKLFPNPTTGNLNIQYEYAGKLNVQVLRADGSRQSASALDFTSGSANIVLNELPQGVYLLVATDAQGNRHFVERVVKI